MGIFFTPSGERGFRDLRAGWRVGIYAALAAGVPELAGRLLPAGPAPETLTAGLVAGGELIGLFWIVLVTWLMARFEDRGWGEFGLPGRSAFGARFWEGAGWGAAAMTVLVLLIFASGDITYGHLAPDRGLGVALGWGLAFLAVGFLEEFSFRGYALTTLTQAAGFWPAAILLSIAFGAVHASNPGETPLGLFAVGLVGLFFCFTWRRTGSLWFAVGMHAAWDFCESFVYGVPDSGLVTPGRLLAPRLHGSRWITGGTAGPEASVWARAVVAALFAILAVRFPVKPTAETSPSERSSASSPA